MATATTPKRYKTLTSLYPLKVILSIVLFIVLYIYYDLQKYNAGQKLGSNYSLE